MIAASLIDLADQYGGRYRIAIHHEPHGKRWSPSPELLFDLADRLPDVEEVERMHRAGIALRWNAMPRSRGGMGHGSSGGTFVGMYLTQDEDPIRVARAALSAWFDSDTAECEAITAERIARMPPLSDYRRGMDLHMRLPGGGSARVWSLPKRGLIHVARGLVNPERILVADLAELAQQEGT